MTKGILAFLLFFLAPVLRAQELDCQVNLNISALSEQERIIWEGFKQEMEGYLNNQNWTTNFSGEKIRCSFQLNIVGGNGNNYTAQLFVASSRPLYQSEEVTTMARFFDDKLEFNYTQGQPLQHGVTYRALESVLDFYVYVILGLDYDSYTRQGGTPYFQQAHQIAMVGASSNARGWERANSSTGTYSRVGYIEDVLNANNREFRDMIWQYNYKVLDLQTTKPEEARVQLANVIDTMVLLKKQSSLAQRSPYLRTFFEAKYPELADLARWFPDNVGVFFQKLNFLDPLHQTFYEEARKKLVGQ